MIIKGSVLGTDPFITGQLRFNHQSRPCSSAGWLKGIDAIAKRVLNLLPMKTTIVIIGLCVAIMGHALAQTNQIVG